MSKYFPKPYKPFGRDIKVKVDLSNYATKADIKNITHVDISSFVLKTNVAKIIWYVWRKEAKIKRISKTKISRSKKSLVIIMNKIVFSIII